MGGGESGQVEGEAYRVQQYLFVRDSDFWADIVRSGHCLTDAIPLVGIQKDEFCTFLGSPTSKTVEIAKGVSVNNATFTYAAYINQVIH